MWHNITTQLTAASTVPMQSAFDESHRVSRITKYCLKNHKLRCLEVLKPILGHTFCLQHSLTRTLQDFGSIQQQLRLQEVKSVCKAQLYSAERRTLCRYYSHAFQSNLFVNLSPKEFQILKGKERGKGKGQPVAIGHYIGHCTELAGKTPEHHFFLCYSTWQMTVHFHLSTCKSRLVISVIIPLFKKGQKYNQLTNSLLSDL